MQRIAGAEDFSYSFVELSEHSGSDLESAAERLCAQLAATPLDVAEDPLAKLTLARLDRTEYVAVLLLHRAVADSRSISILVDELSNYYATAARGAVLGHVPPAQVQFADYARWQRGQVSAPDFPDLRDWWAVTLASAPSALMLPADRSRPAAPSFHGGAVEFDWGADVARQLARFREEHGQTGFNVLLAAFQCVLYRYSRESKVPVGATVSVRPPEFQRLIGPCENTLVFCADFSGRPTFSELLVRIAQTVREALAHRAFPFGHLVRALNPRRDPRRIPLCDACFEFGEEAEPKLRLDGVSVRHRLVHSGAVSADLTLAIDRTAPSVAGSLRFRSSLFDESSARRVLGQVHTLLRCALREPGLPVDELPLDSPEQIRAASHAADRIGCADPVRYSVPELVRRYAQDHPDAIALAWGDEAVTYQQLVGQAAALTAALTEGGAVAGMPVAVRVSAEPRRPAGLLGVLGAGANLVSLGAGDLGERGTAVLSEMRPVCLVLDKALSEDRLAQWYVREMNGRFLDLRLLGRSDGTQAPVPTELDAPAYVTYTSGSTGKPKGIVQSHQSFTQFVTWLAAESRMRTGSRVAQWAAAGYDASLCEMFAALVSGATLCPVPERIRANPDKVLNWLISQRITIFQTVPSFARELLNAITRRDARGELAALSHLLLAGEALPGSLADDLRAVLPEVRLINLYGATETILATWHEVNRPSPSTVPIGRSIPGRQVLVLDELDRPCPAGVPGQIVVRSPYIALGYVGADPRPGHAFREIAGLYGSGPAVCECYLTGDLGRLRWDGDLEFCGRMDEQVKFNGIRLELSDIETALAAEGSIAECAVVAVTNAERLVVRLVAYVVPLHEQAERMPDAAARWRVALRRRFGDSMPPVSFKTLASLPRNLGGKVDPRLLPAVNPAANAARLPETRVEREVADIWAQVLEVEKANMDDSFFDVGGHSLLLPLLTRLIREHFSVDVKLWDFCMNPTLARLAELVGSHEPIRSSITTP